jgi:hypothetical protein
MEFCKDGDLESYLSKNKKRICLKEKEVITNLLILGSLVFISIV